MVTILQGDRETTLPGGSGADDQLWLPAEALQAAIGWRLRPEGLCQGDACVPIPAGRQADFLRPGQVNAAALWRHLGHPAVHDRAGEVWLLGLGAGERAARMASLQAPDFTLPDLAGRPHRLSDYRGRRVLLVSWASW